MNFLHTYNPEPVAFSVGSLDIHWYGIIIAGAVMIGFAITLQFARKKQVDINHFYNLLFLLIIFGLIGGRIGHIIGEWGYYQENLIKVIRIWEGGTAIHGVLFACVLTVLIYSKVKKISGWILSDLIIVSLPLMQAIGRWGNYFNQELFGKPTNLPWGIPIDFANLPVGTVVYQFYHPVFLYESILMLVVFGMILYFSRKNLPAGRLTLLYFLMFSVVRFTVDFFKIDMLEVGPLLLTQWISIFIVITAIIFWLKLKKTEHLT